MAPVTRFAAFKYKSGTTDEQKRKILDGLIQLYKNNEHMINYGPRGKYTSSISVHARDCCRTNLGGRNNNPEGHDKGFDVVFTVQFKVCTHLHRKRVRDYTDLVCSRERLVMSSFRTQNILHTR